jgi:hypothetical protein
MRTRTFVLIGVGLTVLSSFFLSLAQIYAMYKFETYAGMSWLDWLEFIRWHAWKPDHKILQSISIPHCIFDSTVGWFVLLLPAVGLFFAFHPFRKPQNIVLGVLIVLTIMDLCWLLQGCGPELNAPDCCYVPAFLHLGLSILSILCAIPFRLAVREELRIAKEEARE